jgi:predicted N-acyltransferase
VESFHGDEKGMKLTFRWVKLEELEELVFYPKFLCDMLAGPHTGIHHLIHNSGFDDSTGLT